MEIHGIPEHIRSDNGPERVAKRFRQWLARLGTKAVYITPGSPWENGYCESFNDKLRDEPERELVRHARFPETEKSKLYFRQCSIRRIPLS